MTETPARPSLFALFLGFLSVGLFGFGGVLPWARRMVVEQRRWMTAAEFTDMLGLCQFLPGGNIMNLTIALGARFQGAAGAVTAFVGLMAAPVAIVIALGVIYDRFAGLAAAASAMVLANALKIAAPLKSRPVGTGVALVTLGAIAVLRLPLPAVLPVMAAISTLLMWRVRT